jgi:hypothetical protein
LFARILSFCLGLAVVAACSKHRQHDDADPQEAQPADGDRPTDQIEGVPGYLVDPDQIRVQCDETSHRGSLSGVQVRNASAATPQVAIFIVPKAEAAKLASVIAANAIDQSLAVVKVAPDAVAATTFPCSVDSFVLVAVAGDAAQVRLAAEGGVPAVVVTLDGHGQQAGAPAPAGPAALDTAAYVRLALWRREAPVQQVTDPFTHATENIWARSDQEVLVRVEGANVLPGSCRVHATDHPLPNPSTLTQEIEYAQASCGTDGSSCTQGDPATAGWIDVTRYEDARFHAANTTYQASCRFLNSDQRVWSIPIQVVRWCYVVGVSSDGSVDHLQGSYVADSSDDAVSIRDAIIADADVVGPNQPAPGVLAQCRRATIGIHRCNPLHSNWQAVPRSATAAYGFDNLLGSDKPWPPLCRDAVAQPCATGNPPWAGVAGTDCAVRPATPFEPWPGGEAVP